MKSSALAYDLATVGVLWRRDLLRFLRERTRILGAVLQPILFWLILGAGLSDTFRLPAAGQISFQEFFYPGVLVMVVLFASVFSAMSIIEDRHGGFLRAVLVAPGSRGALLLGKTLGATTLALLQGLLFLALAPAAGFDVASTHWHLVLFLLAATSFALTALGFGVAWWLDSSPAYHAFMGVLLIPLWILSGAMFPAPTSHAWVGVILAVNPLSYAVDGLRRALYGDTLPAGTAVSGSIGLDVAVVLGFALFSFAVAFSLVRRRA